jgi:predicted PurR-regulated permease PerM
MQNPKLEIELPWTTLFKVLIAVAIAAFVVKLAPFLLYLALIVLIGVTLIGVVDYGVSKGIPRRLTQAVVSLLLIGFFIFVATFLVPAVADQIAAFVKKLPELQKQVEESISSETIRAQVHHFFEQAPEKMGNDAPNQIAKMGGGVVSAIYYLIVLLILSIYVMLDGQRAYEWILHFFKPATQEKLKKTSLDVRTVILSYVFAQLITCCFVAIYTFTANTVLHIPSAILLATIATICDLIPVIGFFTSLFSAMLLAFTVSASKAFIIAALYILYSIIENYLITPHVYGKTMKLSKLAVLLSILVGGQLFGIEGMLLALPIAGSFTAIEKYWMHHRKMPEVSTK